MWRILHYFIVSYTLTKDKYKNAYFYKSIFEI
jgi:hypothetical protein